MMAKLTEQEQVRRDNLKKIIALGINPYPNDEYMVNTTSSAIKSNFSDENRGEFEDVQIAGRLMMKRIMGKASFAELQDSSGRIQLYINRDEVCPDEDKTIYNTMFKKLLDIGDFIGISGHVFTTQTGEITIHAKSLKLLSKSLKPLPIVKTDAEGTVHDAVTDPEFRYRQRYADLTVNPDIREVFVKRTRMYNSIRTYI